MCKTRRMFLQEHYCHGLGGEFTLPSTIGMHREGVNGSVVRGSVPEGHNLPAALPSVRFVGASKSRTSVPAGTPTRKRGFGHVCWGVGLYSCTTEERLMRFRTLRVPPEWNLMFLQQQISGLLYPYELESRFQTRFQLQKTWKCS